MPETKLRVMTDLIERHCAHVTAGGLSDNTINSRRAQLRRMDAELPMGLEEATVEELGEWLARPGWSRETRRTYFNHMKAFYDWATDPRRPHIDWNPAASMTRPKAPKGMPKPVTDDELFDVLTSARTWEVAFLLAAYGGLRCCELATIERRDINQHTITITGKGGKVRVVPTHPLIWAAVRDLPRGHLVAGTAGQISKSARDHFDRTGMPAVTMHRLRHWFATTALAAGADLLTVSLLMGHASTQTTRVYCEISDKQRRTAILALPVLTSAPAPS